MLVLPPPVVHMLSDKFSMLVMYIAVYVITMNDVDVGVILGVLVGFFHVRFLTG
jgi:MFS superfamily sulfate permease-like transporter